jgi:threonylcarbamoyladenosine tRNA methylthiotransferase MtaB
VKVSFLTMGCRVNQSESSIIEGTLKENGVTVVTLSEKPDFCVVNTCSVTSKGDYNSRQLIRRAARSGARVIVTGCYAHLMPDNVRSMPGVFEVVDNSRKLDIARMIAARDVDLSYGCHSRSRPYLKIQDGCNFRCSYCTVPLARGKSRSIAEDEVIERVNIIESRGYNEIVLTGIHLGTYGRDLPLKSDLKKLLRRILLETRIKRIRLSSLEINEVDDELTEILLEERMCKHLHLPLQSGSDRILKLMRRGYEASFFRMKVEAIASRLNNISLGSDVIAGFPGERDGDFEETVDMLQKLPLSYIHVFPFSARVGTDASKMSGAVVNVIVKGRMHKLAELNRLKRRAYMEKQIDLPMDIILEEPVAAGVYIGTSSNYLKVRASVGEHRKGSIVHVRPVRISEGLIDAVVMV